MLALGPWAWGLRCRRPHRSGIAGPRPMKHDAQPHKRDQHQLGEKEMGDHGKIPRYLPLHSIIDQFDTQLGVVFAVLRGTAITLLKAAPFNGIMCSRRTN